MGRVGDAERAENADAGENRGDLIGESLAHTESEVAPADDLRGSRHRHRKRGAHDQAKGGAKESGLNAEFHDQKTAHGEGNAADPDGPLCGNGPLAITTSTSGRRLGRNASTRVRDGCGDDWLTRRLGSWSLRSHVRLDIDRRLRPVNGRIRLWFRHLPSGANVGSRISGLRGSLLSGLRGSLLSGLRGSLLSGLRGSLPSGLRGSLLSGLRGSLLSRLRGSLRRSRGRDVARFGKSRRYDRDRRSSRMAGDVRYFASFRCGMSARVSLLEGRLVLQLKAQPLELKPKRGIIPNGPIGPDDGSDSHDKDNKEDQLQHGARLIGVSRIRTHANIEEISKPIL